MFSFIKGAGVFVLGLAALAAMLLIGLALIHGMAWLSDIVYPIVIPLAFWTFVVTVLFILPLSLIRPLRGAVALGLIVASYIFGVATWVFGFLVAYDSWGVMGIVVGLILGGVGVVPVAIVASLWYGAWSIAFQLVVGIFLTFGIRLLGAYVATKADADRAARRLAAVGQ